MEFLKKYFLTENKNQCSVEIIITLQLNYMADDELAKIAKREIKKI